MRWMIHWFLLCLLAACASPVARELRAGEIYQRHAAAEETLSVMFGYWQTRRRGGTEDFDLGCMPRLAWQAAKTMGFCAEKLWPFKPADINRPPSFDATAGAIDQKWIDGYYNIWGLSGRDAEVVQQAQEKVAQGAAHEAFA